MRNIREKNNTTFYFFLFLKKCIEMKTFGTEIACQDSVTMETKNNSSHYSLLYKRLKQIIQRVSVRNGKKDHAKPCTLIENCHFCPKIRK